MIQIQNIDLRLGVANEIHWYVIDYTSDAGESLMVKVLLYRDGSPIYNWDNKPVGIKLGIPLDVQENWGTDDSVIDDFVLQALGAKRLM
jgi:hypothetical protein